MSEIFTLQSATIDKSIALSHFFNNLPSLFASGTVIAYRHMSLNYPKIPAAKNIFKGIFSMNINKLVSKMMLVSALSLSMAGSAYAGLIGDTVGIQYLGASDSGVNNVLVGPGEEGNFFGNQFFDFSDSGFSIRSSSNYCGIFGCSGETISLVLTSLDLGAPISDVVFSSSLSGVTKVFGTDSVTFSWNEQSLPANTYLTAEFVTGNAVPEPGSLALLGLALGGLALARKKA